MIWYWAGLSLTLVASLSSSHVGSPLPAAAIATKHASPRTRRGQICWGNVGIPPSRLNEGETLQTQPLIETKQKEYITHHLTRRGSYNYLTHSLTIRYLLFKLSGIIMISLLLPGFSFTRYKIPR